MDKPPFRDESKTEQQKNLEYKAAKDALFALWKNSVLAEIPEPETERKRPFFEARIDDLMAKDLLELRWTGTQLEVWGPVSALPEPTQILFDAELETPTYPSGTFTLYEFLNETDKDEAFTAIEEDFSCGLEEFIAMLKEEMLNRSHEKMEHELEEPQQAIASLIADIFKKSLDASGCSEITDEQLWENITTAAGDDYFERFRDHILSLGNDEPMAMSQFITFIEDDLRTMVLARCLVPDKKELYMKLVKAEMKVDMDQRRALRKASGEFSEIFHEFTSFVQRYDLKDFILKKWRTEESPEITDRELEAQAAADEILQSVLREPLKNSAFALAR